MESRSKLLFNRFDILFKLTLLWVSSVKEGDYLNTMDFLQALSAQLEHSLKASKH